MLTNDETIIAQASAHGRSLRGIVRLSGSNAVRAVTLFFRERQGRCFDPTGHLALETEIVPVKHDGKTTLSDIEEVKQNSETVSREHEEADRIHPMITAGFFYPWLSAAPWRRVPCDLYFWPKNRGFTGQEAIELHLPGSPPVLEAVIRELCETGLVRLAQPGEFTLRAFLSGRIDLTQAEAVLGIIDATSENNLETALRQMAGGLKKPISQLRENLLETICHLEAGFDFVEEDIEFISRKELRDKIQQILEKGRKTVQQMEGRAGSDVHPSVVLIGRPNSGKSSLFNRMSEEFSQQSRSGKQTCSTINGNRGSTLGTLVSFQEAIFRKTVPGPAIISDEAGTTRDYLESELIIDGKTVTLVDTAGIETIEETNSPESGTASMNPRMKAQEFVVQVLKSASLLLFCLDYADLRNAESVFCQVQKSLNEIENCPVLFLLTKVDFGGTDIQETVPWGRNNLPAVQDKYLVTSSKTGFGILELKNVISRFFRVNENERFMEVVPATAVRCRESLRLMIQSLERAVQLIDRPDDEVLIASELRLALNYLGRISGEVYT
ncbi:MAG: 50S ribosome-binding GTPase, partial [Thermoguttaceae bacterium]|nr:50S ribosome-binding GTPase [Thermoguttaceae bacterium]